MIPKTIHYCWFGGAPKSDLNVRCMDSWRRVLPEYTFKEWNETNSPLEGPYTRAAYARGLWSRLSNYVRLHALHEEGGIYLDTDVEVVRDFSPLLHDDCFVGFQQEEEDADWVNTAVMGARRGHPFLQACMRLSEKAFVEEGVFQRSPEVPTALLKEWGLTDYGLQQVEGVTVYPSEYFYPFPWYGRFSSNCVTESTYCVHHWEDSWLKSGYYKTRRPYRLMRRMARAFVRLTR